MSSQHRTHPLNVSYLVVGLVFLGIAGSWALRVAGVVAATDVRWLLPLVLVAAGVVGLVAFAAKGLTRGRRGSDGPDDDPYDPDLPPTDDTLLLGRRTDDEGDLR
jgi:hypothetical protein